MSNNSLEIASFSDILADFAAGKPVVVVDDADRENEGDVCIAAESVTAEVMVFLMREARGLICVSIPEDLAARLNLPLQVFNNNSPFQTPFTISVDHCSVVPSGVTAAARALTVQKLLQPQAQATDFVTPGHIFPLIAHQAGVLGRTGHTEATADLARLSGQFPAGVLCEVLNPDGTVARGARLQEFADRHGLRITSIQEIRAYRALHEVAVRPLRTQVVETEFGPFHATVYADDVGGREHLALVRGDLAHLPTSYAPLVRVHSECLTGDVFGSRRCDCGPQLETALQLVVQEGTGIILYLRQEGRGIGLENKVKAYQLQEQGLDTVEANVRLGFQPDERDFGVAAQILISMGVRGVRLMTNNPHKGATLTRCGVVVHELIPVVAPDDPVRAGYLRTKKEKLGHLLS
jgi:3,4-dihydroxy 2-butanone 4-phosphate synthase/GTP cyclohydrolase II